MISRIIFERAVLIWIICTIQLNNVSSQLQVSEDIYYKDLPFTMHKVIQPSFVKNSVNIRDFGAIADGITSNTKAFAEAVSSVSAKGGGTVIIPEGLWLTGPIELKSNVRLHTEKGAIVLFTRNYSEYPMIRTSFEGQSSWRTQSPIYARDAENIAITGEGIFNGNGDAWRPVKKANVPEGLWKEFLSSGGAVNEQGNVWYPTEGALKGSKLTIPAGERTEKESEEIREFLRPVLVNLVNCRKVLIEGVTFQNSPAWCLHPLMCEDITVNRVKVENEEWAANGDAIDLESCRNALVVNSSFHAGDDGICMKSGKDAEGRKRGKPTENVIVYNCTVTTGHGGFVVGSEMSGGVRNIVVRHCSFLGTDNGLRFKSTRGRGGVVENIYISDIYMANIGRDAILYDLYYMTKEDSNSIPQVNETTPQFRNIHMKNIVCKGANRAILFQGLPEMSLKNIYLENATIESKTGVFFKDAEQINLKNVSIYAKVFPAINIQNSKDLVIDNLNCLGAGDAVMTVSGSLSEKIKLYNTSIHQNHIKFSPGIKSSAVEINN